jgi:hypothetical protein
VGNSVSAGIFPESYWLFGWLGLPLLIFPYGIILSLSSVFCRIKAAQGEWVFLPVLFYALKMGTRVDGQYIADVIGASATLLGFCLLCQAAHIVLMPSLRKHNRSRN